MKFSYTCLIFLVEYWRWLISLLRLLLYIPFATSAPKMVYQSSELHVYLNFCFNAPMYVIFSKLCKLKNYLLNKKYHFHPPKKSAKYLSKIREIFIKNQWHIVYLPARSTRLMVAFFSISFPESFTIFCTNLKKTIELFMSRAEWIRQAKWIRIAHIHFF